MILQWGDISKLKGKEWILIELRSEKTVESTMRRLGGAIKGIFRDEALEIFIPVFKRDLDVFEMRTMNLVFARSTSFQALTRLRSVTGVVQLMTEGESNQNSKILKVEDSFVQQVIVEAEQEHLNRGIGIETGSWVRILNGETRDFCGIVETISEGRAVVKTKLKTKSCFIE